MNEQVTYYKNKLSFESDASDLYEALKSDEKIVVVDTRKPEAFEAEHIPGALNLPCQQMTAESTQALDKNFLYVCYCDGISCNASTKGTLNLANLGFTVKELIGGLQWWKLEGYATEEENITHESQTGCSC